MKYRAWSDHLPRPDFAAPLSAKSTRSIQVDTDTFGDGVNVGSSRSFTLCRPGGRSSRAGRSVDRPPPRCPPADSLLELLELLELLDPLELLSSLLGLLSPPFLPSP
ncbi:hypothetical protein PR002_g29266 [Phytophthora rubi]|uniref:Uncharacterized protein n=1 Tax=Phytophthora rubi TaxID=129364 RepID=A0A6A3H368_9STRA|nr:hypothetical protein PR002_g29266 [Phytophthora rubi]